jgi:hypothetical protein
MSRLRGAAWPPAVTGMPSRRDLLRGLASAGLALGIVGRADPGEAKKRKHTKKVKKNQFGCVDVGPVLRERRSVLLEHLLGQERQEEVPGA